MIKKCLKFSKIIIMLIPIVIISYLIITCLYLNNISENIIVEASNNRGVMPENSKYRDIISENEYPRIDIFPSKESSWYNRYKNNLSKEYYEIDSIKTIPYLRKAKTICKYSYYQYDKNGELSYEGHDICDIYYKFKNGKWVVYDLYFYP